LPHKNDVTNLKNEIFTYKTDILINENENELMHF
jgi:hypothetical protein